MDQSDTEWMVLYKEDERYQYGRLRPPDRQKLAESMKLQYQCQHSVITTSGMHAIASLLHCLVQQNLSGSIVYGNELFCDTSKLIRNLPKIYRAKYDSFQIDVTDNDAIFKLFNNLHYSDKLVIMFIESCSNPNGFIFDWSIIPRLRSMVKKLVIVVDNTWLSSVCFNPLTHGADYVVTSLTKYYSGGNAIGGAIMTNRSVDDITNWIWSLNGIHISPVNAQIIAKHIMSLKQRIANCSNLVTKVLDAIKDHPAIAKLSHPNIESHPSHKHLHYLKYLPGVFTITVNTPIKKKLLKFLAKTILSCMQHHLEVHEHELTHIQKRLEHKPCSALVLDIKMKQII